MWKVGDRTGIEIYQGVPATWEHYMVWDWNELFPELAVKSFSEIGKTISKLVDEKKYQQVKQIIKDFPNLYDFKKIVVVSDNYEKMDKNLQVFIQGEKKQVIEKSVKVPVWKEKGFSSYEEYSSYMEMMAEM